MKFDNLDTRGSHEDQHLYWNIDIWRHINSLALMLLVANLAIAKWGKTP